MTRSREDRITDLHDAMAIQVAVLAEIGKAMREDGDVDDDARMIERIVFVLEHGASSQQDLDGGDEPMDPVDRVRTVVPLLKTIEGHMGESRRWRAARRAVEGVRKVLVRYADVTLTETQPIDLDALGVKPKGS